MCNVSKCHLRDVTFAVINLCHDSDTYIFFLSRVKILASYPTRCIVMWPRVCTKPVPRGYRIIGARVSNGTGESVVQSTGWNCLYTEGWTSNTHVRKYSEPPALRYIPLVLCVSLNPIRDRNEAFVADTSRLWGSMSATYCRWREYSGRCLEGHDFECHVQERVPLYPSPLFIWREREYRLNCCHALCDVHSTNSSPKPSLANRGRKANMTIVGDCVYEKYN